MDCPIERYTPCLTRLTSSCGCSEGQQLITKLVTCSLKQQHWVPVTQLCTPQMTHRLVKSRKHLHTWQPSQQNKPACPTVQSLAHHPLRNHAMSHDPLIRSNPRLANTTAALLQCQPASKCLVQHHSVTLMQQTRPVTLHVMCKGHMQDIELQTGHCSHADAQSSDRGSDLNQMGGKQATKSRFALAAPNSAFRSS